MFIVKSKKIENNEIRYFVVDSKDKVVTCINPREAERHLKSGTRIFGLRLENGKLFEEPLPVEVALYNYKDSESILYGDMLGITRIFNGEFTFIQEGDWGYNLFKNVLVQECNTLVGRDTYESINITDVVHIGSHIIVGVVGELSVVIKDEVYDMVGFDLYNVDMINYTFECVLKQKEVIYLGSKPLATRENLYSKRARYFGRVFPLREKETNTCRIYFNGQTTIFNIPQAQKIEGASTYGIDELTKWR